MADDDKGATPNRKFKDYEFGSEEQRAFFEARFAPYRRYMAEREAIDAKIKDHMLACKQDGIDAYHIKQAYKNAKAEDPKIVGERMKYDALIGSWFGIIAPGFQTELFDDVLPSDEAAYERGRIDGVTGKDRNNPYDKGVSMHAEYENGYVDGQKANAAKLGRGGKPDAKIVKGGGGSGGGKPSEAAKRAEESAKKRDAVEAQKKKTAAAQGDKDGFTEGPEGDEAARQAKVNAGATPGDQPAVH